MNKQLIPILVVGLLIIVQHHLFPQQRNLTVEESVRTGLENSKVLHGSQMKADFAAAKGSEVAASLYPSLRVQAAYQRLSGVPEFRIPLPGNPVTFPIFLNSYSARATLQQPLFTGWKVQAAADNAAYQAEAARHDYAKDKADLIYTIKAAYWGLYRAREIKRLADENVDQISAHLADVENLLKQGMATRNDVLKVQVQLSSSRILQSDAENAVRVAMLALNSSIGLPLNTEVIQTSSITSTTKEFPEVEKLLASAFSQRPELLGMDWRLKASDAAVTAAKGGWFPQLYLMGNYYYARPNPRIFPAKDEFKDTWDIGISIQFDLWNNLTSLHQTNAAKAQYEQTKDALETMKDGITLEVTQSYLTFNQAKQRIRLSELGVEQATENYRVTAEKFRAGLTTNAELLDAEVALLQSNLQLTQALVDYELAEARLEKAIGQAP